ncbi:unnamed protein product [Effrenium voratum]|nr:unnamed protein product [Effrenium voratum]
MGCSTSIARQDVHEDAHIAHSLGVMSIADSDPDLSDCKEASAKLGHQDDVHTGERQAHDRHIRAFNVYLKAVYHAPETFVELVDARRKASFGT